ncbi:MAG: type II secretion system GspH family protein, partial [Vicinamibacterales bacterium]|nr:type II secretion system GspH family protein [Vicinamibacterales bacterium]
MGSLQRRGERGYAMAALLVTLAVMSVILGMAMPVWRTVVQREKEEELIFRGRQYARAIQLYQ